jgi:hypothetical protein
MQGSLPDGLHSLFEAGIFGMTGSLTVGSIKYTQKRLMRIIRIKRLCQEKKINNY